MMVYARDIFGTEFFCVSGGKEFFKIHNMDWHHFVKNGIDSEVLLEQCNNDAQAVKIIKYLNGEIKSKLLNKFFKVN